MQPSMWEWSEGVSEGIWKPDDDCVFFRMENPRLRFGTQKTILAAASTAVR